MLRRDAPFGSNEAGTRGGPGFSQLLRYQAMVGDGVVVMRDGKGGLTGPLLAGYWYQGIDHENATSDVLDELTRSVNRALWRVDARWSVHIDATRRAEHSYRLGTFAEPVDQLIEEERCANARYYVTSYAIFFTYTPSMFADEKVTSSAKEKALGPSTADIQSALARRLAVFEENLAEIEHAFGRALKLRRMRYSVDNDELLSALNYAVNGRLRRCRLPENPVHLNTLLARDLAWTKAELRHGEDYVACVGMMDLPPSAIPGILGCLTELNTDLRWSTRFIPFDQLLARHKLERLESKWSQKIELLKKMRLSGTIDHDAADRADEVTVALKDLNSNTLRFGHYTSAIVLRGTTQAEADEKAQLVMKVLEDKGFMPILERRNRLEVLLGTFPGHTTQNVRKPLINTVNLAHLMPLDHEWPGASRCPSGLFPKNSPPLLRARSWSGGSFDLNLHLDDVGHTLVLGPIGAGKSVLLAHLATQFLRYEGSQVFVFDHGASMLPLTLARRDGAYYALGTSEAPQLCPLAHISDGDEEWACQWIALLCEEQGISVGAMERKRIRRAVSELASLPPGIAPGRRITDLIPHLQHDALESALSFYSSGVGGRVLNGEDAALTYARFTTFETEKLLDCDATVVAPTLMFLFHELERRLDGRPTLILIDEAWAKLNHPRFAPKIKDWLLTLRKKNCAVVMATQQLVDVARSAVADAVFESCMTKILLPNHEASESMRSLYADKLGLNAAQIASLCTVERKRWYLFSQASRSRLFTLDMGPVARAFLSAGSKPELAEIMRLAGERGNAWPYAWLEERGLHEAAERFRALHRPDSAGGTR